MQTEFLISSGGADPHVAWWNVARELGDEINGPPDLGDIELSWCAERVRRLHGMIGAHPAESLEAIACQVRVGLAALRGEARADLGATALEAAIAVLDAFAFKMDSQK